MSNEIKYLTEYFPPIIEEEIDEVKLTKMMDDYEMDQLRKELGTLLFGGTYNTITEDNANMPSKIAGLFGSTVKKWKNTINEQIIKSKE